MHPRLNPRPWDTNYVMLRTLAAQLRAQVQRHVAPRGQVDVIDVGCGSKPYRALFAPYARTYVGVDLEPGPHVDLIGTGESLPVPDSSFDCLICSQVLEHSEDPDAVITEAGRVLRPGGLALMSTHGVVRYHPAPDDYWRWTHAGLERLVRRAGSWESVEIIPNGGTASALAYLFGRELEILSTQGRLQALAKPVIFMANAAGWKADRMYRRRFEGRPPDLAPNYLAVAVRSSDS